MSARNDVSTVWRDMFTIAFQKSPLYLAGGLVPNSPFPIPLATLLADGLGAAVSDAASSFNAIGGNFALGTTSLDDLALDWEPAPPPDGSTLFEVKTPESPQSTAQAYTSNQIIHASKTSLLMKIAPHTVGHYFQTLGIIPLMKNIFEMHNRQGGRYHILTPGYIWRHMVLTKFSDITKEPEQAPASLFQLDFVRPITKSKLR